MKFLHLLWFIFVFLFIFVVGTITLGSFILFIAWGLQGGDNGWVVAMSLLTAFIIYTILKRREKKNEQ